MSRKPKTYSSDAKKSQTKAEEESRPLSKLILPLIIILIVVIVYLLMRGKNTTTETPPDDVHTISLVCEKKDSNYEKVPDLDPSSQSVRTSMIFGSNSSVESVALKYTAKFSSEEEIERAHNIIGVDISKALSSSGFGAFGLNSKIAIVDNTLYLDLSANKENLTVDSASFFLIDLVDSNSSLPSSLSDYRKNYENQGFSCKSSAD